MVDVSHAPALGYMEIVQDRQAATLLPIIQQHVQRGTVIHSDQWSSYSQVSTLPNVEHENLLVQQGYIHRISNHIGIE